MTREEEIAMLKARLAELEGQKNDLDYLNVEGDWNWEIFDYSGSTGESAKCIKVVKTLNQALNFLASKAKPNDGLGMAWYNYSLREPFMEIIVKKPGTEITPEKFKDIAKAVASLDAWGLYRMEISLWNKKEEIKMQISLSHPFVDKYLRAIDEWRFNAIPSDEWNDLNEKASKFRLFD